jgi:hypothetical protein
VLYVPVRPHPEGGSYPEVRKLRDGRLALIAYTALDRLASACGENQPWVLLPIETLADVKREHPFDAVAFDPELPSHLLRDGQIA